MRTQTVPVVVVAGIVPSGHVAGFTIVIGGFTTVGIVAAIALWVAIVGLAANSNVAAVTAIMNTKVSVVFIVLLYYTSYLQVMIVLYTIYTQ
jgi:hypothetical protein